MLKYVTHRIKSPFGPLMLSFEYVEPASNEWRDPPLRELYLTTERVDDKGIPVYPLTMPVGKQTIQCRALCRWRWSEHHARYERTFWCDVEAPTGGRITRDDRLVATLLAFAEAWIKEHPLVERESRRRLALRRQEALGFQLKKLEKEKQVLLRLIAAHMTTAASLAPRPKKPKATSTRRVSRRPAP